LVSLEQNLIDLVWTEEEGRPKSDPRTIVVHPIEFAGMAFESKVAELRMQGRRRRARFESAINQCQSYYT
jgi:hypothetical protein